jgi:Putative zinc-finger
VTDHLSRDVIGDYTAGVLSTTEQQAVERHLSTCPHCSALAADAEDVQAALSDLASSPPPMPELVWRQLEARLRSEAQSATGVAADRPGRTWRPHRPARRLLSAAAAVLVAAGVGVALERGLQSAGTNSPAASTASGMSARGGGRQTSNGAASSRSPQAKAGSLPTALAPDNVTTYARRLAAAREKSPGASGPPSGTGTTCATPRVSPSALVEVVQWRDAPAVLVVRTAHRQIRVFDCRTAARVLYAGRY